MRIVLTLAAVVVVLYALIDCILTAGPEARVLPKWLWLVVIVVVPVLGAVGWILGGRPSAADGRGLPGMRRRTPTAPDDDPAFLRKLADDEWSRKMRQRREDEGHDAV